MTKASGAEFDGVRVARPATAALAAAGFETLEDLPSELGSLLELHGVGPKAVRMLGEARTERSAPQV